MSNNPTSSGHGGKDSAEEVPAVVPGVLSRDPLYFGYYALLTHQQNMLLDTVRTAAYHSAIVGNAHLFTDRLVMDLGAGSGILSYFAALAGAHHVFAIEASAVAQKMSALLAAAPISNPALAGKITVIQSKIEDLAEPLPKVDVLVSEPIGVLLFHERMLESFLLARDRFLKPGGTIIPSRGTISLAPFTDAFLFTETQSKARFWEAPQFYGVDLSPLFPAARQEYFSMPVVGHINPATLMSDCTNVVPSVDWDFSTVHVEELHDVIMPIEWVVKYTGLMHGIAGWFDLLLSPIPNRHHHSDDPNELDSTMQVPLTTHPRAAATHWHQVRLLFTEPLAVNAGERVVGWVRAHVNAMRSYTMVGEIRVVVDSTVEPSNPLGHDVSMAVGSHPTAVAVVAGGVDVGAAWVAEARTEGGNGCRRGRWMLHDQTYSYTYQPPATGETQPSIPLEQNLLYLP
ncbi:S-adenosyl-L-methionine-dependent methyltransferase [Blastocladiella britannica]|nr:S-adenosyl-L-methionine-dependent methyltransferase [Blastocladiella britannica]